MSSVFDLRNVLQLIENRFDNRPFSEQDFVARRNLLRLLVLFQFGQKLQARFFEQQLKRFADVAFVAEELAPQPPGEFRDGFAVIRVSGRDKAREQFAAIGNDDVQLEAVKPADACFTALGDASKLPMLRNSQVFAHRQSG